jgi:hypothetical protein
MQIIRGILLLKDGVASWVDQFGNSAADPALTIAVSTKIVLDIRQPLERSASTSVDAVLPAYPIEQLASTGLYFAMDSDYDQETIPKLIRTSDISVSTTDDGTTQVDFEVPNTNIEALHTALNNGASVSFKCELGGVDDSGATVFVIQFSMGLRNRIYIPGDSPDTPDPEDPAWLPAIRAIIAAEVADAAMQGDPGTPSYTYVAYASDADGTDFSLTPSGELEYRAEFVSSTLISEPDLDDFITANAVFVRYIVPGAAGASSKLYVAYATADDGSGFSLTPGADKPYRAEFISSNLALTPVLADFTAAGATWVKYLGTDGIDGFGVTPQGAWSADNSPYDLHDMVTTAYGWFLSLIDNNNAAPPVPPATSDSWQLIVANGRNGYNVIRAYNTVPDADDTGWHTTQMADDLYYRDSMDGGVTWTAAVALSQAAVLPIARFAATYVEADADWWAPVAEPGVEFATARCAYFRFKLAGGSFSPESLIIQLEGDPTPEEVTAAENLLLSADLSIQYSATSAEDGDWHGALAAGDRYVRLYNAAGTVRVVWNLGGTAGVDIAAFEVAVGAGIAWHDIPQVTDHYMKISVDGGATWGGVFRINAESAYDEWLAAGNIGTREDFLDSLKGEPGVPGPPGSGIHIDASGTLAERDNYDSTPLGFVYLASDGDGSGGPALFQRSSATQGSWSSAVPVTVGPKGADGKDGKDGAPGAAAPIVPDFEFTSAELLEDIDHGNHLLLDGTTPIAQVELYDAAGNGIVIERGDAAENGRCMIVTRWSAGETIIYFGELDVSRGGRVRFAQGSTSSGSAGGTTGITAVEARKIAKKQALIFG